MSIFIRRGATFWLPTMAGSVRERNLRNTPCLLSYADENAVPD